MHGSLTGGLGDQPILPSEVDLEAMAARLRDMMQRVPDYEPISAVCLTEAGAERLKAMLTPAELARVRVLSRFEK
jgi:hypothetical protein